MNKLIKTKIVDGNEVSIYRIPIEAGMQFCYTMGKTKNNKIKKIGYYDFEIVTSPLGETISEKALPKVFYK